MKRIGKIAKKAMNWYAEKYAECYGDRYHVYAYRVY